MSKLSLKHIIGKRNGNSSLVLAIIEQLNAKLQIEDEMGNLIAGNAEVINFQHPIKLEDEILGWVKGDEKTLAVASLLSLLAQKDLEKKKLASEVLTLYQEVNMV